MNRRNPLATGHEKKWLRIQLTLVFIEVLFISGHAYLFSPFYIMSSNLDSCFLYILFTYLFFEPWMNAKLEVSSTVIIIGTAFCLLFFPRRIIMSSISVTTNICGAIILNTLYIHLSWFLVTKCGVRCQFFMVEYSFVLDSCFLVAGCFVGWLLSCLTHVLVLPQMLVVAVLIGKVVKWEMEKRRIGLEWKHIGP